MLVNRNVKNHFGMTGKWLFIWLMVVNSTSMLLFGYDQGVFGEYFRLRMLALADRMQVAFLRSKISRQDLASKTMRHSKASL